MLWLEIDGHYVCYFLPTHSLDKAWWRARKKLNINSLKRYVRTPHDTVWILCGLKLATAIYATLSPTQIVWTRLDGDGYEVSKVSIMIIKLITDCDSLYKMRACRLASFSTFSLSYLLVLKIYPNYKFNQSSILTSITFLFIDGQLPSNQPSIAA